VVLVPVENVNRQALLVPQRYCFHLTLWKTCPSFVLMINPTVFVHLGVVHVEFADLNSSNYCRRTYRFSFGVQSHSRCVSVLIELLISIYPTLALVRCCRRQKQPQPVISATRPLAHSGHARLISHDGVIGPRCVRVFAMLRWLG